MKRIIVDLLTCILTALLFVSAAAQTPATQGRSTGLQDDVHCETKEWIGTWATAQQHFVPGGAQTFRNQTLRLIVHTSVGSESQNQGKRCFRCARL